MLFYDNYIIFFSNIERESAFENVSEYKNY